MYFLGAARQTLQVEFDISLCEFLRGEVCVVEEEKEKERKIWDWRTAGVR